MTDRQPSCLPVIGWREWIKLPQLGISQIKAKVDTGARSSALYAVDLALFEKNREQWVEFTVHPTQRTKQDPIRAKAKVLEFRSVKSSSGRAEIRPVIVTEITLLGKTWPVELTLADRTNMGFRMLLGREAFRGRFLVDTGKSYYGGKPKRIQTKSRPR